MNQELPSLVIDPGPKADDVPGEQRRRRHALAALQDALAAEERVRRQAAETAAACAREAVWLGASLADLAAITGHTRQAARKRWAGLGDVQRRRAWLARHTEDVPWAAGLLLEHREALTSTAEAGFSDAVGDLDDACRRAAEQSEQLEASTTPALWHALDGLVDRCLRRCLELAGEPPADTMAGFAVHGAHGVVGYYDHAVRGADSIAPAETSQPRLR